MITYTGFTWVQLLTLLVSVVLPILVALATQRLASSGLKSIVLAALAAIVGILSELLDALVHGTTYDVGAAIVAWLTSFIVAVAVHYGLLKPVGVTGSGGLVAAAVPAGIGTPSPQRTALGTPHTPGRADHAA